MDTFEGFYHKLQTQEHTLALIVGHAASGAFIQVVAEDRAYTIRCRQYVRDRDDVVRIDGNVFAPDGIALDIHTDALDLTGHVSYANLTPPARDYMGPLRFLPLECRHRVPSLCHNLSGQLRLNGQALEFTGGHGYLEGDSGRSFPTRYQWAQCIGDDGRWSMTAAVARIPFAGLRFWGGCCIVWIDDVEYRLATYSGMHITQMSRGSLALRQRGLRFSLRIDDLPDGHPLDAPKRGAMTRSIRECPLCRACVRLTEGDRVLLDEADCRASYEHVDE